MIRRIALAVAAICLATQGSALSCMVPSIGATFQVLSASEKTYAILVGRISYDGDNLTEDELQDGLTLPAQFVGVQIGKNGRSVPVNQDMTVSIGCIGPWCGYVDTHPNMISFVEVTQSGFHLEGSACPGSQFFADEPETWDALQSCLNGGVCGPTH